MDPTRKPAALVAGVALWLAVAPGAVAVQVGMAAAADPPEMMRIAAGTFIMGRAGGPADERPAHRVTLAPFLIDRLPVTNAGLAGSLKAVIGKTVDFEEIPSEIQALFDRQTVGRTIVRLWE